MVLGSKPRIEAHARPEASTSHQIEALSRPLNQSYHRNEASKPWSPTNRPSPACYMLNRVQHAGSFATGQHPIVYKHHRVPTHYKRCPSWSAPIAKNWQSPTNLHPTEWGAPEKETDWRHHHGWLPSYTCTGMMDPLEKIWSLAFYRTTTVET